MYWYEEDVRLVESIKDETKYPPRLAFYGSSSIRLWETIPLSFGEYDPINLGFGGSTLEACVYFFNRIFQDLSPEAVVLYAGDNDLGDGKSPENVLGYFKAFIAAFKKQYPDVPLTYMSIKPSIARQDIVSSIETTNKMIMEYIANMQDNTRYVNIFDSMLDEKRYPITNYYVADGLHLSSEGYGVWNRILHEHIDQGKIYFPNKNSG